MSNSPLVSYTKLSPNHSGKRKHAIDTIALLETKTKGNLTPEEKELLTRILYELKMHYVRLA